MAKKKINYLSLTMQILQIVFVVLLFCTLAMTALTTTGKVLGVSTTSGTNLADFIKAIFDGNITNGWAITALIFFLLSLLFATAILVKTIYNMVAKKKIKVNYLEIILLALTLLFFIIMIIYASTLKGDVSVWGSSIANASTSISWATFIAPISALAILLAQIFSKR